MRAVVRLFSKLTGKRPETVKFKVIVFGETQKLGVKFMLNFKDFLLISPRFLKNAFRISFFYNIRLRSQYFGVYLFLVCLMIHLRAILL